MRFLVVAQALICDSVITGPSLHHTHCRSDSMPRRQLAEEGFLIGCGYVALKS